MTNTFKRILWIFVIMTIICIVVSVVFFVGYLQPSRKIENVDHMSGQRIGVITAYEGDYVLTGREDITLCRYDTEAEAIVALCYNQVDALATNLDAAQYVLEKTNGIKINDVPIATNGMASIFSAKSKKIVDEYNAFIKEYKKTDEYNEYVYRCNNQGFNEGSPITEETGTGDIIKVGYCYDYIPTCYFDVINDCPSGSEVDIIRKFANHMNYQIEWIEEGSMGGYADLWSGNIDVLLDGYSDVYRAEIEEESSYVLMGDNYRDSLIVLLEVEENTKVSIGNYTKEVE